MFYLRARGIKKKGQRRSKEAFGSQPGEWAGARLPDRIHEDAETVDLQQKCRMAEPGNAKATCKRLPVELRIGTEWAERRLRLCFRLIAQIQGEELEDQSKTAHDGRYGVLEGVSLLLRARQQRHVFFDATP